MPAPTTDDELDALGKLIRDARGDVPQDKFAERLGIKQSQLSAVECGAINASLVLIGRLIRDFGIDESELTRAAVARADARARLKSLHAAPQT